VPGIELLSPDQATLTSDQADLNGWAAKSPPLLAPSSSKTEKDEVQPELSHVWGILGYLSRDNNRLRISTSHSGFGEPDSHVQEKQKARFEEVSAQHQLYMQRRTSLKNLELAP